MHSSLFEMMGAARAGFYKKRVSNPMLTPKKKRNSSASVTSSPARSTTNRLAVPNPPLRKRSGSAPSIKLITLASIWNLKHEHIRALKTTWARLCEPPRANCKGIVSLVERVWEKLDTKDKDVRNIFYNAAFVDSMHERCERRRSGSIATLRDHTHFFVSLVSQVVSSLEKEPAKILEHLDHIGQSHAYLKRYGFKSSHWEKVGEYFVDHVVIQDCVRGFPEACRAWTVLVSSIVDRLRAAPRRGSFLNSPSSSRRGSMCTSSQLSINDEAPKCPFMSKSANNSVTRLSCSESVSRRGSIVLPATTIDMSTLKDALPTPPHNLHQNNNHVIA
ncbi:GLOBIN domain-containing protein [Caenorhabditis elegans]|uniref:GLOBIN domain-containing protein n=2 Tax=Caenorhabditis elegans TaxID=6239 RepID=H9G343_CAEEL|nr:GLOBIN domain-containing protein [Caenorhabditis elegans]CCG28262.1 GLOBIN domain-containing protein [Caenorhabditis elegans]|eukprot:NP_001256600.1 GLoBin related [Caenorhabditis elegans]